MKPQLEGEYPRRWLTGGRREIPEYAGAGVALVAAGYRLSPQVPCPVFIEDAAAAVAWTFKHIADYGGDPRKVFVGGHSAGGYLALMLGMDPQWPAFLRKLEHPDIEFHEIPDLNHGTVPQGAAAVMPSFIGRNSRAIPARTASGEQAE